MGVVRLRGSGTWMGRVGFKRLALLLGVVLLAPANSGCRFLQMIGGFGGIASLAGGLGGLGGRGGQGGNNTQQARIPAFGQSGQNANQGTNTRRNQGKNPSGVNPRSAAGKAGKNTGKGETLPAGDTKPTGQGSGVLKHLDVAYGKKHGDQKLDLHIPEQGTNHPLVIFIHGGGFFGGDKKISSGLDEFVARGYALASINYKLVKNPGNAKADITQAVADCRQAVRFLRKNARKFDVDPKRFAAFGVSAGGYYAAMLGALGNRSVAQFDAAGGSESAAVQAVVEYAGPIDFFSFGPGALGKIGKLKYEAPAPRSFGFDVDKLIKQAGGKGGNISKIARGGNISKIAGGNLDFLPASVLKYVNGSHPPTRIIHGDKDQVVPVNQSKLYHSALKKAGVRVELEILKGQGHEPPDDIRRKQIQKAMAFIDKVM